MINMVKRTLEFRQLNIYILFKVLHVIGICMAPGMPKTWTSFFFFFDALPSS
jgi:cytochrome b561